MKVLALASYPIEAAATRYRLSQFVAPLAERGIEMTVSPFLDSRLFRMFYQRQQMTRTALGLLGAAARRLADVRRARAADVLLVQREAMLFGPPIIEWLSLRLGGCPMVLDLDDATYVSYTSPTYGRLGSALKWFRKTDDLIRWAKIVTCGNHAIAEYVARQGTRAELIPTVVDTDVFRPRAAEPATRSAPPTLGWIGTHSTFPFLESLFPVLQELARSSRFRLRIVGAGRQEVSVPGVEVESLEWSLEREVADFQSFDIGLYPIAVGGSAPPAWVAGKSGFKSVQYMAVGLPFVVTPVGACAEIGEASVTHFCARTPEEWLASLRRLLEDVELRRRMGAAGRAHALGHYTVPAQAEKLAQALRAAQAA